MQPEILMLNSPISFCFAGSAKCSRQRLRDRDRTGGGQRAIIEAGAGENVGDEADIRRAEAFRAQDRENFGDVVEAHMRQDDVLGMGDARLIEGIFFGEIGDDPHLLRGRVAWRLADGLERNRQRRIAALLVAEKIVLDETRQFAVAGLGRFQLARDVGQAFIGGRREKAGDAREFLRVDVGRRGESMAANSSSTLARKASIPIS